MRRRKQTNGEDRLPRGHAYIHMRARGDTIHIDYPEVDCAQAKRIMDAVMTIVREEMEMEELRPVEGGFQAKMKHGTQSNQGTA